jgi:hypothetical protein
VHAAEEQPRLAGSDGEQRYSRRAEVVVDLLEVGPYVARDLVVEPLAVEVVVDPAVPARAGRLANSWRR